MSVSVGPAPARSEAPCAARGLSLLGTDADCAHQHLPVAPKALRPSPSVGPSFCWLQVRGRARCRQVAIPSEVRFLSASTSGSREAALGAEGHEVDAGGGHAVGMFFWAVHFVGPRAWGPDLCWLGRERKARVPRGCWKEAPQSGGGLKQRKLILSRFWRPDVQTQGRWVEIKVSAGGAPGGGGPSFWRLWDSWAGGRVTPGSAPAAARPARLPSVCVESLSAFLHKDTPGRSSRVVPPSQEF